MLSLTLIGLILSFTSPDQSNTRIHQVNVLSSKLVIHGETNVNSFDCELIQQFDHETLQVTSENSDFRIDFDGLVLKYGIGNFDCGNELMNKDFRSILKSEDHPFLFLKINEILIREETSIMEKLDVRSFITISLAGVERTKMIEDGTVMNQVDNVVTLTGSQNLQMTDFNIEPPKKFMGLVTVKDELHVSFEIRMQTFPIK